MLFWNLFPLQPAQAADTAAYRLGSGDKLRITVFGEKDLSGTFDVNDQGKVALPLIGPVEVGGRSISDVEEDITARYAKDYLIDPRVNVEVLNYRPFFILGEVRQPNSYPYVVGMSVLNAIALAGGYTPRADTGHIVMKHANDPAAGEQPIDENAVVLPGDIIRVPERIW
jgi:protein involved in polysaccharide export with SLBB domain